MPPAIIPPSADGAATPETPPSAGGELTGSQVALTAAGVAKEVVAGLDESANPTEGLGINQPESGTTAADAKVDVESESAAAVSTPDSEALVKAPDETTPPVDTAPVTPWTPAVGTTLTPSVPPVGNALGSSVTTTEPKYEPTTTTEVTTSTTINLPPTATPPISTEVAASSPSFGNSGAVVPPTSSVEQ